MVATTLPDRLKKQLEALPSRPGVYLMRDAKGEVIYVGKAARLKDRVRSYFGAPRSLEPKTRALRAQVEDFEYIVCGNAGEALILEATLIKRHQPFFNIRLKDDKRYPYLKVDVQNPWPRVYITRRIEKTLSTLEAMMAYSDGARIYEVTYDGRFAYSDCDEWDNKRRLRVLANGDALLAVEVAKRKALEETIEWEADPDIEGMEAYSGPLYDAFRLREVKILAETD